MFRISLFAVVALLSVFSSLFGGVYAVTITRKVGKDQPTRFILYHSRNLQASCYRESSTTCSPTKAPGTRKPTKPPTKRPTKLPTRAPSCNACPPCQVATGVGCGCTSDCCATCPAGTQCVMLDVNGNVTSQRNNQCGCKCVACECGFCDHTDHNCCNLNGGGNNCNPNNRLQWQTEFMDDCAIQNGRWPQLGGATGNVCSGIEINPHAMPNGCGCQPSQTVPCIYDPNTLASTDDRTAEQCYVCDVEDLVMPDPACSDCIPCLRKAWVAAPNNCKRRELQNGNSGASSNTVQVACTQTNSTAQQCVTNALVARNSTALLWCFRQIYSPNNYVFDDVKRQLCYQECAKKPVVGFGGARLLEELEGTKRGNVGVNVVF